MIRKSIRLTRNDRNMFYFNKLKILLIFLLIQNLSCTRIPRKHIIDTYYKTGEIESRWIYPADSMEVVREEYYEEEGGLKTRLYFKGNNPAYFAQTYYPTGELKEEWDYQKEIIRRYYLSGALQSVGQIKEKSSWKSYYETGELEGEWQYRGAKLDGMSKQYYRNGSLKMEGFYEDDNPRVIKIFYPTGGLKEERDYQKNIKKTYSPQGGVTDETPIFDLSVPKIQQEN